MTLDTLVAIFALLVAAFALAPRSKMLSIKTRTLRRHWAGGVLALIAIHILLFYKSLTSACLFSALLGWFCFLPKWPYTDEVLSPGQVAYFVMIIVSVLIGWILFFSKLARGKIFDFQKLAEDLVHSKDYPTLFSLLDKDLNRLLKIAKQDFPISNIRQKFTSTNYPNVDEFNDPLLKDYHAIVPSIFQRVKRSFLSGFVWVEAFLPSYEENADAAQDVFRQVMTSKNVVHELVISRPYFALRLLNTDIDLIDDFSDIYFRELLIIKHSVLYFEVRSNQNIGVNHAYDVPKSNRILNYLFDDARVAEKLSVWKPIGESFIERLDQLAFNPQVDTYNRPMGNFHASEKWEDQLYVSIFFFDIMVSKAMAQNIQWHMWLYYFPHFVRGIIANYKIDSGSTESDGEWPTRYSYLLYTIMSTLNGWLRMVSHLPENQENILMTRGFDEHENGNIPKSTAFVLTDCLKQILLADHIPAHFKSNIADSVLATYFNLRIGKSTVNLAALIRHRFCIWQYASEVNTQRFISLLQEHARRQDRVRWHNEMQELDAALTAAVQATVRN